MKRLRRTTIQSAILFPLAFILISFSASSHLAQQTQSLPAASTRPDVKPVSITVTVTDRKRNFVKGLVQGNFAVYEGKHEQQITAFSIRDVPLSVGIIFDASASVKGAKFKQAKDALAGFFQLSHKANEYFLLGFNRQPQLLQDWTSDAASIVKQLDAVQPIGNTALYDACYLGIAKVMTGHQPKRVVILISDGQDNESKYKFSELRRLLEETNVLLYSISIHTDDIPGSSLSLEAQSMLEEISSMTGGTAMFPESRKEVEAAFDALAIELRNQYQIAFAPTAIDKKPHRLKIKVALPADAPLEMQRLTVRSREKFYAQTPPR